MSRLQDLQNIGKDFVTSLSSDELKKYALGIGLSAASLAALLKLRKEYQKKKRLKSFGIGERSKGTRKYGEDYMNPALDVSDAIFALPGIRKPGG